MFLILVFLNSSSWACLPPGKTTLTQGRQQLLLPTGGKEEKAGGREEKAGGREEKAGGREEKAGGREEKAGGKKLKILTQFL